MPSTPKDDDLPSTLQRSDEKAQDTYAEARDSALDTYDGDGQAAARVAWSAVKHTHEKVGDHWEPKEENGPSDEQSAHGDRDTDLGTAGGVDENASKAHLYERAQELDVEGRSTMTKDELVEALEKANDKATRDARG